MTSLDQTFDLRGAYVAWLSADVGGDQVARLPEISPFAIDRTKSAQEQVLRLAQQQRENASKRSQSGLAAAHTQ